MGAPNNLSREMAHIIPGTCSWCGRFRARLYRYGGYSRAFCNVECFGYYHDVRREDYDYIEPRRY